MRIESINSDYPRTNINNKPTFKGSVSKCLIEHMDCFVKEEERPVYALKLNLLKEFVKKNFKWNIVLVDDSVEAVIHRRNKVTHKYDTDTVTISPISFVRRNIMGKYDKQQFTYNVDEGPGIKRPLDLINKVLCMTKEEIAQANKGEFRKYVPTEAETTYYDTFNKELAKRIDYQNLPRPKKRRT